TTMRRVDDGEAVFAELREGSSPQAQLLRRPTSFPPENVWRAFLSKLGKIGLRLTQLLLSRAVQTGSVWQFDPAHGLHCTIYRDRYSNYGSQVSAFILRPLLGLEAHSLGRG